MLTRTPAALPYDLATQAAPQQGSSEAGFDLATALSFARRQWLVLSAVAITSILIAILYLLVTPPVFVGKANLLLDTRKLQLFQQQSVLSEVSFDAPAVESQIEILKSESIAAAVVDELKLASDPEFTGANVSSFFASTMQALGRAIFGSGPSLDADSVRSQEELGRAAIAHLRNNLQVQRLRMTYVIEIGVSSLDAGKAARIANAVAEAYILDQTQSKAYTTRRAVGWLEERMKELREQAVAADRAVQDFRTKNNILKVGSGASMDEQQLGDLAGQLSKAREQTADARARLDRINEIIASRVPDASMTAWLQNDVITRLRQQYVDASRREADFAVRLGSEHQAVVNARKELRQIERAAADELRRVAEGFKNDYEIAQSRERAVAMRLDEQKKLNEGTRQEQGALHMLESAARAYQSLHDSFLQRYAEATQQQQNVTSTEARVITAAAGAQKVSPNARQVLTLGAVLGIMLGFGAAYARERLDNVFRTPKQVEHALGIECLGVLPAVESKAPSKRVVSASHDVERRIIEHDLGIARQVILTPFSRFTETVRSIKVAVDTSTASTSAHVVGLVSAVPAEGKSTVSSNLAQLAAHGGARVLLIDGDLRNPSLTRLITPFAEAGVLEVLQGETDVVGAVWHDPITGMDFLPAVLRSPIAHTAELLSSRQMRDLVAEARNHYEYVVIDFPPLAPVVDARAASSLVDSFILVVEWGQTSPEIISEALGSAEVVQSKLIGAVLNRANPSALKRLEAYKGKNYHSYYTSYLSDKG